jgi:hypothetical protein
MGRFCSTRFTFAALTVAAGMHATNPALAQNVNDLLTIFGGGRPQATRQAAQAEWRRLPPAEIACIDQRLRRKGSSVEALVRRGVKPSAGRLIELRSSCRQFVESVQTDTAPELARDATGSSTPTVPASNPTEPKGPGAKLLSSAEPVGPVAEEQVQQGNVELKDSLPESGTVWSSATLLVAVIAIAALLGIVVYLFIRWRNTGQRTVVVSAATDHVPEKNSEGGAGKAPSETTIGKASEVVMPITMSQNSGCSSETESTNEEILPDTVLSESSPDSSVVANVAELAKLCAKGTPSEKEFQRIKGLISQSLGDFQEPKLT